MKRYISSILAAALVVICLLAGCADNVDAEISMVSVNTTTVQTKRTSVTTMPMIQEFETTATTTTVTTTTVTTSTLPKTTVTMPPTTTTTRSDKAESVPVLCYHHIVPDVEKSTDMWKDNIDTMSAGEFDEQMNILKENGFYTITLEELYQWKKSEIEITGRPVVITFDDGYKSARELAAPILKKHGFCATIFVIGRNIAKEKSEWDGQKLQVLSEDEVQNDDVLQFYSHTYGMHNMKDGKAFAEFYTEEQIRDDFDKQAEKCDSRFVAYPFGRTSDTFIRVAQEKGTLLAFETVKGSVTRKDDDFRLPRYAMYPGNNVKKMKFMKL